MFCPVLNVYEWLRIVFRNLTSLLYVQREWVLVHRVCNVAPPCYSSAGWINQLLVLISFERYYTLDL